MRRDVALFSAPALYWFIKRKVEKQRLKYRTPAAMQWLSWLETIVLPSLMVRSQ